jgi:hypothetical protein
MGAEQPAEPALFERVDDMQGPGCRIADERDELTSLIEPLERIGQPVRRVAKLARAMVCRVFAPRREQAVRHRRGNRTEDEEQGALEPPTQPAQLEQRRGDDRRSRLDDDVTAFRVRDLVGEHAFELGRRQGGEQAGADRDRLSSAAPGGERARVGVADQV